MRTAQTPENISVNWRWPLALMVVALIVYAPALWNGFVWDDTALVLRDPFIRSWRLIPEGIGHFLFADATASDFYRPMQRLLFTFDYAVFGFNPWGYHLMSVLLHGGAAVALFFLLKGFVETIKRGTWLAAGAALIWLIHPLHTSAVTYVAGSADLLAALFGFSALTLAARARSGTLMVAAAALCFLGAMLSKESGGMFLVVWLVWLVWNGLRRDWRRVAIWTPLALAIAGTALFFRFSAVHDPAPRFASMTELGERPALMLKALGEYARLVLAPLDLHMERTLSGAGWLLGLLVVAAGLIWGGWAWRRRPRAFELLVAALLAYLPISNVFSLNAHVAEHWLYVPLAFLLGAVVASVEPLEFSRKRTAVASALLALWVLFLSGRTFVRNFDWRDQRTFVERTIEAGGNSVRMQLALASLEMQSGNLTAARAAAERALERSPDHPFGLIRLASISIVEGNLAEARSLLENLKAEPFFAAERLVNLAAVAKMENPNSYLPLLEEAAALDPRDWAVQKRYIVALWEAGQRDAAQTHLMKVLERQPYRAESWELLGHLLQAEGRNDAEKAFAEAARRDMHLGSTRQKKQPPILR